MKGMVFIVGAGPGDAELITLKGLRAIEKADVILYDALVDRKLFELIDCTGKELIFVGKRRGDGDGEKRQRVINELMLDLCKKGRTVVRLKGGDPGIFGRLADEIRFLKRNGIPYEVIPGVSSFNGVASHAGIPLTEKGISSLTVLSGTENFDLNTLINGTFVVMMARENIERVAERLIELGVPESRAVIAVENGTLENQRIVEGTLGDIHEKVRSFTGPTLFIIGDVVSLKP